MDSSCKHKHVSARPHNRESGMGIFGRHWECTHQGCEFNNDAWLHDSIVGACYLECDDCGDIKFIKGNFQGFNLRNWINCGPEGATPKDLYSIYKAL